MVIINISGKHSSHVWSVSWVLLRDLRNCSYNSGIRETQGDRATLGTKTICIVLPPFSIWT